MGIPAGGLDLVRTAFLPTEEDGNDPHPTSDITTMEPEIDIPELVRYGA